MNLSIIIVNYNTQHYIVQTIQSILRSKLNIDHEIIVVDNNSHDDSCRTIKDKYPDIKLIKNSKNLGFSAAVNVGAGLNIGLDQLARGFSENSGATLPSKHRFVTERKSQFFSREMSFLL